MFGFFIAAGCFVGLVFVARHRFRHADPRWGMYRFFSRLEASPGQEKVIREQIQKVKNAAKDFANETRGSRKDLAELLSAERFDGSKVRDWFAARERSFDELKPQMIGALEEVHEVLDPVQREKLGKWVASGPGHWRSHGGYDC